MKSTTVSRITVSIRALRAESDDRLSEYFDEEDGFNSRSPGGERFISGDVNKAKPSFNSRSPGGERLTVFQERSSKAGFNSRSPGGER